MRKILFLILCLLFISEIAEAQMRRPRVRRNYLSRMQRIGEFSYFGSAGISSYYGDLKQSIELSAKPMAGGGALYRLSKNLSLRGELFWYRISGADSQNRPDNPIYARNLSFRADNLEGNVTMVGYLYNKYSRTNRPILNPYAFAGLGFTTNSPKAEYEGEWYSLRPLQTEGRSYGGILLAMPFGIGLTYHDIIPQLDLAFEVGYRFTMNDYMDDVSTSYQSPDSFVDPVAYALADRREEFMANQGITKEQAISGDYAGPYKFYFGSNYRGNPSNYDWYLISGIKLIYTPGTPTMRKYRRK